MILSDGMIFFILYRQASNCKGRNSWWWMMCPWFSRHPAVLYSTVVRSLSVRASHSYHAFVLNYRIVQYSRRHPGAPLQECVGILPNPLNFRSLIFIYSTRKMWLKNEYSYPGLKELSPIKLSWKHPTSGRAIGCVPVFEC